MPYFGDATRLIDEARRLLSDESATQAMSQALRAARAPFDDRHAATSAADHILDALGLTSGPGGI